MHKYSNQTWLKSNPGLQNMEILVGDWEMQGTHPKLPDPVRGRASFAWIEEGAFLLWETEFEQPLPPNAIAVISRDETTGSCSVLYFDERGVSRIYEMSLEDGVWRTWRNAPGFLQRTSGRISADRNTINGTRGIIKRWFPLGARPGYGLYESQIKPRGKVSCGQVGL